MAYVQALRQQNEAIQAQNVEVQNQVAGLQALKQQNQALQQHINLLVQENQVRDGIPV